MAHAEHAQDSSRYYFPHGSKLPFFGSASLFVLMAGAAATLNGAAIGGWVLGLGFVLLFTLFFLWFGEVIRENQAGLYGVPKAMRRTAELLREVHLADKAQAYARTLSGDMKRQRQLAQLLLREFGQHR